MTEAQSVAYLEKALGIWSAQVKAAGGQVTVFPSTDWRAGQLAARYPAGAAGYRYVTAPDAIQAARAAVIALDRDDIEAGARLAALSDAVRQVGAWLAEAGDVALAAPRKAVEKILGVPVWLLLLAALGLATVYVVRASRK